MRVLVTGGTGFIGRRLAEAHAVAGDVVAITSRTAQTLPGREVLEVDIRHRRRCDILTEWQPDRIYHLAAYHHVGRSFTQVEECFDVNAKGSANVLEAAGPTPVLYMSSSEVYGQQATVPWHEAMTPHPRSPYAVTKYAGELFALMRHQQGFPVAVVRAFNVFGPGQSDHAVMGELIRLALRHAPLHITQGTQTREFNYVDNIVDGLVRALAVPGGPYNLAGGHELSIRALAEAVVARTESRSVIHADLPDRENEIWRMRGDATLAKQTLGWTPAISFAEGLDRTIAWYRKHP